MSPDFWGNYFFLKSFGVNDNLQYTFLRNLHFLPFYSGKAKSHIFENLNVMHQLKTNIEWISNCNIKTVITRLCFDTLKTFFRILLLQMAKKIK